MPSWLERLTRKPAQAAMPAHSPATAVLDEETVPAFSTRLAVDSPGAPGRAGAEALYNKWASRWQEF